MTLQSVDPTDGHFVPVSDEELKAAYGALPEACVLVGGQALAYWMAFYEIPFPNDRPVTVDADFLTLSADDGHVVKAIAKAMGGTGKINPKEVMSALVGTVEKAIGDGRFVSVDVIFKVFGMDEDAIRRRSHAVEVLGSRIRVMDPLDVLESRLKNLYKLSTKQTDNGFEQLRCSIAVIRRLQQSEELSWRDRFGLIEAIARLASSDAGRKVAGRFGVFVADAVVVPADAPQSFAEKRLPQLVALMSPEAQKAAGCDDSEHVSPQP